MTGKTIGKYLILEKLGSGGMGVVYRAEDTQEERLVAIKFLSEEMAGDAEALARFQREARAAAMLDHPNICTVFEIGEHEGRPFIVMPLVEGRSLKERLAAGPLETEEFYDLALQITGALEAAHSKGIVHRDIKPGNIIITASGQAKVLDFGLAKRVPRRDDAATSSGLSSSWGKTLTTAGMPVGTLEYMSPEQVRGEELDERTDLFSLGLVLYEMSTRRRAFEGTTPGVVLEAILVRTPPPPSRSNPELPPAFDAILHKLLEKDRELRYQTAADLRADLKRVWRDSGSAYTVTLPAGQAERLGLGHEAREARRPTTRLATRWKQLPTMARWAFVALGGLILAFAGGVLLDSRRAPALTDRDIVVLADFANSTGEPVFDGALKQALAVQLGQSPFLNILPEQRVREALRFMGRSPDERVTREVAREICLREGLKALIAGSISRLGRNYVLTLEAVEARGGDVLASEQVEAAAQEQVLAALGRAASRLRVKLGESLSSIERFDAPLERATTSSLEALRAFSLGDAQRAAGREFESSAFFKRALELDGNFALAQARLAAVYANLGEPRQAVEHGERAYELRDRVSERERYYIAGHYYRTVTGDIDKAIENYEMWKRAYPHDSTPLANLSAVLNDLGQFERALAEAQAAAASVNPTRPFAAINIAAAHMGSGRFREAREVLNQILRENPQSSSAPVLLFMVACAEGDAALMQQQLDWADGKESEAALHLLEGQALAARGELGKAREVFHHALDLARRFNRTELAATVRARQALVEAEFGNPRPARTHAEGALASARGKDAKAIVALALARAGDLAGARKVADELAKQYPADSILNAVSLPSVRAAIEIERGHPGRAVEFLRTVVPYELGFLAGVAPTYLRGQAFLLARDGVRAAAEFEKIIARPGVEAVSPLHSLARLGLGRAHALTGETEKGRAACQEFLARWQYADPDLPALKDARTALARL